MSFLDGNSEVLESLVNQMDARGLSTRDVEDAFRDATGELPISKSAVSEITDRLWEEDARIHSTGLAEAAIRTISRHVRPAGPAPDGTTDDEYRHGLSASSSSSFSEKRRIRWRGGSTPKQG
jgi:hypothetical protein